MKKLVASKKAMMVVLVIALICAVLEVVTSIRMSTKIDFFGMTMVFSCITIWAASIEKKEKLAK